MKKYNKEDYTFTYVEGTVVDLKDIKFVGQSKSKLLSFSVIPRFGSRDIRIPLVVWGDRVDKYLATIRTGKLLKFNGYYKNLSKTKYCTVFTVMSIIEDKYFDEDYEEFKDSEHY